MAALDDMMLEEARGQLGPEGRLVEKDDGALQPTLAVRVGGALLARSGPAELPELRPAAPGAGEGPARTILDVAEEENGWTASMLLRPGGGDFSVEVHWPDDGRPAEEFLPSRIGRLQRASESVEDALAAYFSSETTPPPEGWSPLPGAATAVLEHARCLSDRLAVILLFDREGLVHALAGHHAEAEMLAATAGRLRHQSEHLFSSWKLMSVRRFWLATEDGGLLVADLAGSDLSLMVQANGAGVARGLAETACRMIGLSVPSWASPAGHSEQPGGRRRYAWFQPPVLLPQSPFVSRRDSGVFHVPHCRRLSRTPERRLEWFGNRADALRAALRPCQGCKP